MEFRGLNIVCPACRQELRHAPGDSLACVACARTFPVLLGIPDLRLWPDPYIGFDADREKAGMLARDCATLDFESSIELYYRRTAVVPEFQVKAFTRGLLAAAGRAAFSLERWERVAGIEPTATRLLEIGCGTAPLLAGASPRYARTAGIDIALRWLVMAAKRLEQDGLDVPLFCACAEALPFEDESFDAVVADSTLEVVRELPRTLAEADRVLRAGGAFMAATPNRFSLGPDPHAGLWAGGWLPKAVVDGYVRRKGGIPPHRMLLSRRTLRKSIEDAGLRDVRIFVPPIPAAQRDAFGPGLRRVIDLYNRGTRSGGGSAVLSRIGPLLHAVARKPAVSRPPRLDAAAARTDRTP
jgi:ubiquinone/menaquinone biosynthesis C-methylase UbiE/uncharacterized protein YbaR (Trm112 family)